MTDHQNRDFIGTTKGKTMTKRKHLVTFLSPDTFVNEQTTRTIAEWDRGAAVKMAETIKERYGAVPYGFYFTTDIVSDDVDDGEGGKTRVQPKEVARSPLHYLGGEVLTYEQLCERGDPKDEILLSNMRCNDIALVLQNCNSYRHTTESAPSRRKQSDFGFVAVEEYLASVLGIAWECELRGWRFARETLKEHNWHYLEDDWKNLFVFLESAMALQAMGFLKHGKPIAKLRGPRERLKFVERST